MDKPEKVLLTLRLDADVIEGYKALAEAMPGAKYQALMNEALRAQLEVEKKDGLEARVARLESEVNKLKKRND